MAGAWMFIGIWTASQGVMCPCMQFPCAVDSDYAFYVPCSKGQIVNLAYGGTINTQYFRFTYDEGLPVIIKY